MRVLTSVVLAASLVGCASGYQSFYKPVDGYDPAQVASYRAGPPPAQPVVQRSAFPSDIEPLLAHYARRGYVVIGEAAFNSGTAESDASAIKQAKAVGADLVHIFNPQYTGSNSVSIPMTTPTTSTSFTNASATVYGSSGPVRATGTATTTTYGTQTTYIPMTVHRSDYGAIYFVKQKFLFGAFFEDLSDSQRKLLQSNKGAEIKLVVDGTPAYQADILPGDIIVEVNGRAIEGRQGMQTTIDMFRGQSAEVTLVRNGERMRKSVRLND